jgi:ribosomal protein S18 acetylase RimI-like enzyme
MGGFTVRNCRPNEVTRVIELLKATELFWEIGDREEVFAKKLEFDPDSVLVMEHEGKIMGTVSTIYDPWASFWWHLAIESRYQGRGLAHLLADEVEKRLKARGTTSVNGYVLPSNRNSLSFLKKRGFSEFHTPVIAVEKPFKEVQ